LAAKVVPLISFQIIITFMATQKRATLFNEKQKEVSCNWTVLLVKIKLA